jgi:hypothetical protein
MIPGGGKIWAASEVWSGLTAVVFLAGVSGFMLWTALRGVPARLGARVQKYTVIVLSLLWITCMLASFTVVNEVDALAPAVWLFLVLCPICILILLADSVLSFRKMKQPLTH